MEENQNPVEKEFSVNEETVAEQSASQAEPAVQTEPTAEEQLKKQLEEMTEQYQQMREVAARAQAEGINYRNWAEREMKRLKAQGGERAVLAMLPVFDSLEMALSADTNDVESLKKGVDMVRNQFEEALKSQGVNVLDPRGQLFSPLDQEAFGMVPVEDKALDGVVQHTIRKGFKMAEKVIRPAQVLVGRYTAPETPEAGEK